LLLLLVVVRAGFASYKQGSACVCVGKSKKQGEARRRRRRQIVEVEDRVCDVSVVEFLWIAMGSLWQIQMGRYDGGKKIWLWRKWREGAKSMS